MRRRPRPQTFQFFPLAGLPASPIAPIYRPRSFCGSRFLERLNTAYEFVSLPVLDTLSLHFVNCKEGDPFVQFYKAWDMPSLRRVEASTVIPALSADTCARLTSCRLVFSEDVRHWNSSTTLLSFLEVLTSVQDLDLFLDRSFYFDRASDSKKFTLPKLSSLSSARASAAKNTVRTLLAALGPCPKLKRLSLDATLSNFASEQDWLRFLGPFGYSKYAPSQLGVVNQRSVRESQFPALEHLSLCLRDHYDPPLHNYAARSLTFDDAFEQLRHLKHLTLRGNRFRKILHWSDSFPRLTSLRLEGIDHLDGDLINYVASRSKTLRMKNCSVAYGTRPLSHSADQKTFVDVTLPRFAVAFVFCLYNNENEFKFNQIDR